MVFSRCKSKTFLASTSSPKLNHCSGQEKMKTQPRWIRSCYYASHFNSAMCTTIYSFLIVVRAWPSCLLRGLRCGYVWTIFHKVPLFNTTRASILSLPCSLVSKHDIFYCHGHTLSTNLAYHPLRSFYELHYFLFVIEGGGGSFIFFIVIFIILMFT